MFGVRFHHAKDAELIVSEDRMLMLNAAAAAPQPAYNLPEPDPSDQEKTQIASDLQFMCIGILLGVLASLLYWQFAKACERMAKERRERDLCQQNPNDLIRGK